MPCRKKIKKTVWIVKLLFESRLREVCWQGYSKVGAKISHPDGVERVAKLCSSFTHVKDKQTCATNGDATQVLPICS